MEPRSLVFSFECLVSNGRRALLGGIRLDGSATYVILILRARQTSHKGQQSLTELNAKASNIYVEVFLAKITCMALVEIQALSYRNSSYSIFVFFKR